MRTLTTAPEIYPRVRERLLKLATTLDASQHEIAVPALPLWTVRDTYAHITGVVADVLAGKLDGVGGPEWTAVQVAERADHTLADICAEWVDNSEPFDTRMRTAKKLWPNALDLWHHEQDIRAALGAPVDRDDTHVRFVIDFLAPAAAALWPADSPAVLLVADDLDREWRLGPGDPATTVRASGYELARAMAGRRSRNQLEALGWNDPAPYIEHMPMFALADKDLVE